MQRDYRAICDQCASEYKLSQLRKRFDGAIVCPSCWEPRHPQEHIRPRREPQPPRNVRPDREPVYIQTCPTTGVTATAGYAVVGCSVVGNATVIDPSVPEATVAESGL